MSLLSGFFVLSVCEKEKEGTFERFLFKGAPCHLKVLLPCTWRDEARYQGWVVKKGSGMGKERGGGVNSRRGCGGVRRGG